MKYIQIAKKKKKKKNKKKKFIRGDIPYVLYCTLYYIYIHTYIHT